MQYLGIEFSLKNQPRLDGSFIPFGVWERAYLKGAEKPFKIAVEREGGLVSVFETKLRRRRKPFFLRDIRNRLRNKRFRDIFRLHDHRRPEPMLFIVRRKTRHVFRPPQAF